MGLGGGAGVGFGVGVGAEVGVIVGATLGVRVGVCVGGGVVAGLGGICVLGVPAQPATITSKTTRLSNRAIILERLTTARLTSKEKDSLPLPNCSRPFAVLSMILQ